MGKVEDQNRNIRGEMGEVVDLIDGDTATGNNARTHTHTHDEWISSP